MAFKTYILVPGKSIVEIDALTQVTHTAEVDVTEHPVEVGANISDHARLKPEQVTLTGLVSDTLTGDVEVRQIVTADGVEFTSPVADDAPAGAAGRAEAAFAKLREIKDARQLVTVVTELRTYTSMILTSLTVPREPTSGDALHFTIVFKEVILATVQAVDVKVAKSKAKSKMGAQATPPASADDTNRSNLHRLGHDTGVGNTVRNFLRPPGAK